MASLTIRKLDDRVKQALRMRAAQNGHSMEEEARAVLEESLSPTTLSPAEMRDLEARLAALRAPGTPFLVDELIAERRAQALRE